MNQTIPSELPKDIEREMDILFARIEEKMANIRRTREEGEEIMRESHKLAESNRRALEELGERISRWK